MTYREAIKESLDTIKFSEEEGGGEILPITAHLLVMNMSAHLVYFADKLLKTNYPTANIDLGGGKAKKKVTLIDIIKVLSQNDFMRSTTLGTQFNGFLTWILDQEVNTDYDFENDSVWYDYVNIGKKWNEYASMKMKKEGGAT
jgi:hypothetical protein